MSTKGLSRAPQPGHAPRDQDESVFATILSDLVGRVPGARSAALVDSAGETVDYAGRGAPYDVRVAAAHWRIVLDEARAQPSLRAILFFVVRSARGSAVVHALPEGYAIVLLLARGAGFSGFSRAVLVCARRLGREAGWVEEHRAAWHPVDALRDRRGSPRAVRIEGRDRPLEILGSFTGGLTGRERGWRVRLDTGFEVTLVREPGGFWYADDPPEGAWLPTAGNTH